MRKFIVERNSETTGKLQAQYEVWATSRVEAETKAATMYGGNPIFYHGKEAE